MVIILGVPIFRIFTVSHIEQPNSADANNMGLRCLQFQLFLFVANTAGQQTNNLLSQKISADVTVSSSAALKSPC